MSLQNKTEFILFKLFVKISNFIGIRKAHYAGTILAYVFFYIIPIRKHVVISNIRKAFPEFQDKKIKETAFQSYRSFATALLEILCIPYLSREDFYSLSNFPELKWVKEQYNLNKGLIFLTAHYGNWELGAVSMGVHLNIPIHVLVKPQRNSYVSDWLNMMRESFGNKVIPLGVSVKNIFKELQQKHAVGIVGDQRGPREGIRVSFFNQKTATYPGTAALAIRTQAPVIVALTIRQKDHTYKMIMKQIDPGCYSGTDDEKILKFNQDYMKILEDTIREYPEQWLWMHNIWKY